MQRYHSKQSQATREVGCQQHPQQGQVSSQILRLNKTQARESKLHHQQKNHVLKKYQI